MSRSPLPWLCAVLVALWVAPVAAQDEAAERFFARAPLTGEVLLRLEVDDEDLLKRFVARSDVEAAEHRAGVWPVYSLSLTEGADAVTVASALERVPGVSWAWADRVVPLELHALPLDDTYAENLWHLENVAQVDGGLPGADIDVVSAWDITTGEGQLIGVIDGGVELTHPDLRVADTGWDAISQDGDANPDSEQSNPGHGTLVAGVAAAVGNNGEGVAGVAHGATVWPVRAIGGGLTQGAMYDAFVRAVDAGCTVINNSWGYNTEEPCAPIPEMPAMNEAFAYALENGRDGLGTVLVFSAGNSGCEQNNYDMLNNNANVIAVASINDQGRKWGYSVWGAHVDLGAPSGGLGGGGGRPGLWSTDLFGDAGFNGAGDNNEYSPHMGGTSGAAPVVSGTVALMLAANPRLREAEVRAVLCATADKIDPENTDYDSSGWSPTVGCGRVNAGAAVQAGANDVPPAPVLTFPAVGDEIVLGTDTPITWEAVEDPDGDALTYEIELRWTHGDDDSAEPAEEEMALRAGITDFAYVLRELDWDPGTYEVRVADRDLWGTGEWSDWVEFGVAAPIPPPLVEDEDDADATDGCSGCGGGDGSGSLALLLLAAPFSLRRRRG